METPTIPDWRDISGFFDEHDAGIYRHWAEEVPDYTTIVELGTWLGRSAACALTNLITCNKLHVKLVCIDIGVAFRADKAKANLAPYNEAFKVLRSGESYTNLEVINADALRYYTKFTDESIWACFIDSNHDYDPTKKQLERWWPKIAIGGRMGFHDHSTGFPGVMEAVTSGFPGRTPDFKSGSVVEFVKRKSFVRPVLA